jgi:hypothetical protein
MRLRIPIHVVLAVVCSGLVGCDRFKHDPLAEMKEIIENHAKKTHLANTDLSFDVKKTDSLVSPYTGTATCSNPEFKWEVSFVYQENKWLLKSIRYRPLDPQLDIFGWMEGSNGMRSGEREGWHRAIEEVYYPRRE